MTLNVEDSVEFPSSNWKQGLIDQSEDFWQCRREGEQAHRADLSCRDTKIERDKGIDVRLQIQDSKRLGLLIAKRPWLNYDATSQVENEPNSVHAFMK